MRRFLRQRFGTVYLSFAKPISLRDTLSRRSRFSEGVNDPRSKGCGAGQKLGFRPSRRERLFRRQHGDQRDRATQRTTAVRDMNYALGERSPLPAHQGGREDHRFVGSGIGDFRESLDFLAKSGAIDRMRRETRRDRGRARESATRARFLQNFNDSRFWLLPSPGFAPRCSGRSAEPLIEEVQHFGWTCFGTGGARSPRARTSHRGPRSRCATWMRCGPTDRPCRSVVITTVGALDVFREYGCR